MNRASRLLFSVLTLVSVLAVLAAAVAVPSFPAAAGPRSAPAPQADNPAPPAAPVKLIFIHHSTGENWLTDGYGNLGQTLAENNYFVSDTNYGWGPDSIGDNTDIPNWMDWFRSDRTPVYMDALYNESGQNSGYTRLFDDPGGENQIIMFKSCFPNSALEGNPDDPPDPDGWLTVGHAKYVYNEILQYFASRPDKLFVVITAPPLSDGAYAENARAFNNWLVNDWLAENNYTLNNVAVFDFYNVLTARDAHHWYNDGEIQHVVTNRNTLFYPSGDDHPSERGSQKATDEFVPLLNIFYNRWAASGTANLPPATLSAPTADSGPAPDPGGGQGVPLPPDTALTIDDFEGGADGWEAFWDASTSTTVTCAAETGAGDDGSTSLRMEFSVAAGSWATCALFFDSPQDWSGGEWLAFDVRSEPSGLPFNVIVYGGTPDARETYLQPRETPVEYAGFVTFTNLWEDFLRADWEDGAGSAFDAPEQVVGLAFGFDAGPDAPYTGVIWIDNIRLEVSPSSADGGEGDGGGGGLPCAGSALLPLIIVGLAWAFRRR
ncbi:MAG: Parallel beta-helix repeat (Two copies) [Anaerolineaceae bacterium]|nr:MAG: Parallel beta-helix repeat (Two copies) [Anaerolineaceae bacterium]